MSARTIPGYAGASRSSTRAKNRPISSGLSNRRLWTASPQPSVVEFDCECERDVERDRVQERDAERAYEVEREFDCEFDVECDQPLESEDDRERFEPL